ncbi:MAG: acyl carrier protein [Clostridium sp.]|nr:acyl carrier protein [Clostridium sp.]
MEELKQIFSTVTGANINDINNETSRDNNDVWDSFNHLLLISEIEDKLKIKFTMEEVEKIQNFKQLNDIVLKKRG